MKKRAIMNVKAVTMALDEVKSTPASEPRRSDVHFLPGAGPASRNPNFYGAERALAGWAYLAIRGGNPNFCRPPSETPLVAARSAAADAYEVLTPSRSRTGPIDSRLTHVCLYRPVRTCLGSSIAAIPAADAKY
jgi:hypothetical protein